MLLCRVYVPSGSKIDNTVITDRQHDYSETRQITESPWELLGWSFLVFFFCGTSTVGSAEGMYLSTKYPSTYEGSGQKKG